MRYNRDMKDSNAVRFAYKLSPPIIVLCVLGFCLCAASFAFSSWQFAEFLQNGTLSSPYEWIKYVLWYGASAALAVLTVGILVRSRYLITESELIVQFGFVRQRYPLKGIYSVHLFRGAKKLAVYFDDYHTDHIAVSVHEDRLDEFVRVLTDRRPAIGFTFSTAEEEEEFKKKK